MDDMDLKMKQESAKKRRSTKTYPPKSSFTDKFNLSDSPEYNDDKSSLSDSPDQFISTTTSTNIRTISNQRKQEIWYNRL